MRKAPGGVTVTLALYGLKLFFLLRLRASWGRGRKITHVSLYSVVKFCQGVNAMGDLGNADLGFTKSLCPKRYLEHATRRFESNLHWHWVGAIPATIRCSQFGSGEKPCAHGKIVV